MELWNVKLTYFSAGNLWDVTMRDVPAADVPDLCYWMAAHALQQRWSHFRIEPQPQI